MADICKKCTLISREFCTFLNLRELSQAVMQELQGHQQFWATLPLQRKTLE